MRKTSLLRVLFINRISTTTIFIVVFLTTIVSNNLNWGKNNWDSILEADAKGYYAYLPAIFIYSDLNFGFFDTIEKEKYYSENRYYDYRSYQNGKYIDKYFAGTALAQLPFFLIAHGIAKISSYDADGYSKPYAVAVSIAALFYLLLSLIFINKLLKTYSLNENTRAFVIFALTFGTNIFFYVVGEPGMSHIYSLAFISLYLYSSKRYFDFIHFKWLLISAFALGIIILIRPINGFILFSLPFISGDFSRFKKGILFLLKKPLLIFVCVVLLAAIPFIQLLIYKISTGSFFIYSYTNEKLDFSNPHFFDFLFSYKKGWFLYTPLAFLSMFGFINLYKKSKNSALFLVAFFTVLIYVLSSWWNWWYGGSFSSRVMVEFLPLNAILLAFLFEKQFKKRYRNILIATILTLIIICQIQTYQYRYYQIHWENMDMESYWNVFLRIDKLIF